LKVLLLLLLAVPAMAAEPEVDCSTGGSGLYEQSMCKDQKLAELRQKLEQHLSPTAVGDFDMSAMRVCQGAWKPTRQVLIYPLVVRGCLQNLMEAALEEVESGARRYP
tara:strand:- start:70 stop:393 length:324 start_codon:yes stop_codon:yes gene_type:complete